MLFHFMQSKQHSLCLLPWQSHQCIKAYLFVHIYSVKYQLNCPMLEILSQELYCEYPLTI